MRTYEHRSNVTAPPRAGDRRTRADDHHRRPARAAGHSRGGRSQHPHHAQADRFQPGLPLTPALAERTYPAPAMSVRGDHHSRFEDRGRVLRVDVRPNPLTVVVKNAAGQPVQNLVFESDGNAVVRARRSAGARHGRGRTAAGAGQAVARAAGPVRPARPARHDGAAVAERHVRLAQSGGDAGRHRRAGASSSRRRGCRSICATRDRGVFLPGSRPPATTSPQNERNQQQAARQGAAAGRRDRSGPVRRVRVRRARSGERR